METSSLSLFSSLHSLPKPCHFSHSASFKNFLCNSTSYLSLSRGIRVVPAKHHHKTRVFVKPKGASAFSSLATAPETVTENIADENLVEMVVLPTNESSENLLRIRHTCAHVMAMAVQRLFPDAKVTIGPWIDNGFYYDFDMEPLTDKDLKRIKKEMDRIISQNLPLIREEVSREEAQKRISAISEPFKLEILESIKDETITIYHIA